MVIHAGTSRHALAQIAKVRPAVFITSVAREIARYNNLAANAQALNITLSHHVLARSKAEILHLVEQLIDENVIQNRVNEPSC